MLTASLIHARPETPPRAFVPIRRVLCPVDFSAFSAAAVDHAVAMARPTRAEITGLFVLPVAGSLAGQASPGAVAPPDVGVASAVQEDLEELFGPVREAGLALRVCVRSGDCAGQIVEQAREREADLIVMGTHGRSGLKRVVLGSIAAHVLRTAPCPVLTVDGRTRRTRGPAESIGAILCALDLSEASAATLSYALELGRSTGVTVVLLHVLEGLRGAGAGAGWAAEVRQHLHAAALADGAPGCALEEMVVIGRPHREIVRAAETRGAGLIVLGADGRDATTAGQVVRDATVPVLTVRP
jgi:nucleotide-binding universal stress UspA family protein